MLQIDIDVLFKRPGDIDEIWKNCFEAIGLLYQNKLLTETQIQEMLNHMTQFKYK